MLGHPAGQGLRQTARALGGPCTVCRQWGLDAVCASCLQLHAKPRPRCRRCAEPLAIEGLCAECTADPPPFLRTHVAVDYGFPWDRLIADLKFGGATELARPLAAMLAHGLTHDCVSLVVPVPLAPRRLRERGFNQAALLAGHAADLLQLPPAATLLQRPVERERQSGLTREARLRNLRGVFMVDPAQRQRLAGRHVALVDDVVTTGATGREAAAELLRGGAAQVELWAVARTA